MSEIIYPLARYRPVRNHSDVMSANLGLVLHVQEGTNDLFDQFNNPASQTSYTFDVWDDGLIDQFMDARLASWAQKSGNDTYSSVGTKGFASAGMPEAMIHSLAGLYRWGHDTLGWAYALAEVPGERGFGWHGMGCHYDWGHCVCPGEIRRGQRQEILDLAQGMSTEAPPSDVSDQGDDDMNGLAANVFQPHQIDTFRVNSHGQLIHRFFVQGHPGVDGGGWNAEILADGLDPSKDVIGPYTWADDGFTHLYCVASDETQVELVWDPATHAWTKNVQN